MSSYVFLFFPFSLVHGDVLIHVLAAYEGIIEHVCQGEQIDEIAWHVAHEVGEEVLYHWENAAAYHHHHENAGCLGGVFAEAFSGKVEDGCPHHRGAEDRKSVV